MKAVYTVTSLVTLETRNVPLDELSRNLLLNSVIQDAHGLHVGIITHHDIVFFARTWAGWALDAAGKGIPAAAEALLLVDKWLLDPKSVSREELEAAAEAAWAAAGAVGAAGAARAAAGTARAATWAVGAAAGAVADAAATGVAAARFSATGVAAARAAAYKKQGEFIIEHLQHS